jgi:hypothetical protein
MMRGVVGRVGAVGAQADAGDCWRQTGDDRAVATRNKLVFLSAIAPCAPSD